MKLNRLWVIVFLLCGVECMAQGDTLTLKRCIELRIENNLSLKNAQENIRISQISKTENRNKLIPVIQGFANFSYNIEPATSVSDGSGISAMLGMDIPYMVNKALDFQTTAGVQLAMPLYNQRSVTTGSCSDSSFDILSLLAIIHNSRQLQSNYSILLRICS